MPELEMRDNAKSHANGFGKLSKGQLIGTIIGLQLTLLLAAIDQTIVATAMPRIIAQLNGFDRYAWVTTAYLLTVTASIPIFGRISDIFGRKWVLLAGAIFFVLTSALCGAAGQIPFLPLDGMTQLILFRGLQGLGGGVIMVVVFSALGDLFPPAVRGKYMGLFSGIWALASLIGPTLGGWLTDKFSWRSIFYINLPLGLFACLALYLFFPYAKPVGVRQKIDYWGATLLIAFLLPLLFGINDATMYGIQHPGAIGLLAASLVLASLFILVESHAVEPIIPLVLLRTRNVQLSLVVFFCVAVGMFSVTLFTPLFMQVVMRLSPTKTGSIFTSMMLAMASASATTGQLMSRFGRYKLLALVGLGVASVSVLFLSKLEADTTNFQMVCALIGVGMGLGMTMPVFTISMQNAAPPNMMGAATALAQFLRSIGGTVGAAVMGSLMQAQYSQYLGMQDLSKLSLNLLNELKNPTRLVQDREHLLSAAANSPTTLGQVDQLLQFASDALVHSLSFVFVLSAVLLVLAFCVTLFLEEKPLRSK
jgi:EmrB/QacA subfamily drug resistance transporter